MPASENVKSSYLSRTCNSVGTRLLLTLVPHCSEDLLERDCECALMIDAGATTKLQVRCGNGIDSSNKLSLHAPKLEEEFTEM